MANDVDIRLHTRTTRTQVDAAIRRILTRVAADTAQGAAARAKRKTGFMASTVGSTPPGGAGPSGRQAGGRIAVAQPAAGPAEAYAFAAAAYALFVELKDPFLLPAAQAVLADIAQVLAEEGV